MNVVRVCVCLYLAGIATLLVVFASTCSSDAEQWHRIRNDEATALCKEHGGLRHISTYIHGADVAVCMSGTSITMEN